MNYFYIKSVSTGLVVTGQSQDALRSQVTVNAATLEANQLWYWKGQFICNKANDLVLDIRKGRLRLIEDTEICLYHEKALEEAHNQLWGIREDVVDSYGKRLDGVTIYSTASNEWVLDIQQAEHGGYKLVLFPLQQIDNDNQHWSLVPEGQLDPATPPPSASYFSLQNTTPPASANASPTYPSEFPQGLSPAKRGSHSSIFSMEAFKDYHTRVYTTQEANLSDKGIAMASAYHIFQNWKLDQISHDVCHRSGDVRSHLQSLTQAEVSKLLLNSTLYANNHKDSAGSLASRLVLQLYDQTPISP